MREPVYFHRLSWAAIPWLRVEGPIGCEFFEAKVINNGQPAIICETDLVLPDTTRNGLTRVACPRALPHGYTEQQLVVAAASTVREIYDHEWREQFVYRGQRVFNPHEPAGFVLPVRP